MTTKVSALEPETRSGDRFTRSLESFPMTCAVGERRSRPSVLSPLLSERTILNQVPMKSQTLIRGI